MKASVPGNFSCKRLRSEASEASVPQNGGPEIKSNFSILLPLIPSTKCVPHTERKAMSHEKRANDPSHPVLEGLKAFKATCFTLQSELLQHRVQVSCGLLLLQELVHDTSTPPTPFLSRMFRSNLATCDTYPLLSVLRCSPSAEILTKPP